MVIMKKILMLFCIATLFMACSKDDTTDVNVGIGDISVDIESLAYLNDGAASGESAITVTSSGDWRLVGGADWCTPSATEGVSGESVTFTLQQNENGSRSQLYSFVCGNSVAKVSVEQNPVDLFEVIFDNRVQEVTAGTSEVSLSVKTNSVIEPMLIGDAGEWLTLESQVVDGNIVTIKYTVRENTTFIPRSGDIKFNVNNVEKYAMVVNQEQNNGFIVDKVDFPLTSAGGKVKLNVRYNQPISFVIDSKYSSWLTQSTVGEPMEPIEGGVTEYEVEFDVAAATGLRMGRIYVQCGQYGSEAIFISQAADNPIYGTFGSETLGSALAELGLVVKIAGEEDKYELTSDVQTLTSLDISDSDIASLDGLELFESLTTLDVSTNYLTMLDLTPFTNISSISIKGNGWESINTGSNPITEIDLADYYALRAGGSWASPHTKVPLVFIGEHIETVKMANAFYYMDDQTIDLAACPSLTTLNTGTSGYYKCDLIILSAEHHENNPDVNITKHADCVIEYK